MKRFGGEILGLSPRIALITNDSLGNYVAATPLMQMLRSKYPGGRLDYFGGIRTKELWQLQPELDSGSSIIGVGFGEAADMVERPYDLAINLEGSSWASRFAATAAGESGFVVGPCVDPRTESPLEYGSDDRGELGKDSCWSSPNLAKSYPFLQSGAISEIFCRLCYLDGPIPEYTVELKTPRYPLPRILISTCATLPSKLWSIAGWRELLALLAKANLTVGIVGAAPEIQARYWVGGEQEDELVRDGFARDCRGALTLPELAGAFQRADLLITVDNGLMHLAAAVGCPTIALFRSDIHRLWAPPVASTKVLCPEPGRLVSDIETSRVIDLLKDSGVWTGLSCTGARLS